jgi:hypothetical protein
VRSSADIVVYCVENCHVSQGPESRTTNIIAEPLLGRFILGLEPLREGLASMLLGFVLLPLPGNHHRYCTRQRIVREPDAQILAARVDDDDSGPVGLRIVRHGGIVVGGRGVSKEADVINAFSVLVPRLLDEAVCALLLLGAIGEVLVFALEVFAAPSA